MTAFLIFLGVWSLVALAISLLLGSALGRRRPAIDSLGSSVGKRAEGERPGGEASGTPSAAPRRDVTDVECVAAPVEWETARRWRDALAQIAAEGCRTRSVVDGGCCCVTAWVSPSDRCMPCVARAALDSLTPSVSDGEVQR